MVSNDPQSQICNCLFLTPEQNPTPRISPAVQAGSTVAHAEGAEEIPQAQAVGGPAADQPGPSRTSEITPEESLAGPSTLPVLIQELDLRVGWPYPPSPFEHEAYQEEGFPEGQQ